MYVFLEYCHYKGDSDSFIHCCLSPSGSGSISGRVSFPGWGFPGFSLNVNDKHIFSNSFSYENCPVTSSEFSSFLSFFLFVIYPPSRDLQPKCLWVRFLWGCNRLWTRTLDRYTRVVLSECVISSLSGPPRETTQDRTQRTYQSKDRNENS